MANLKKVDTSVNEKGRYPYITTKSESQIGPSSTGLIINTHSTAAFLFYVEPKNGLKKPAQCKSLE